MTPGDSRAVRLRTLRTVAVLAAAVVLTVVLAQRPAGSAFTSITGTVGNQVSSAAVFGGRVATGSYTGNGLDNRAITGLGFRPDVVLVKTATATYAVTRTSTMTGDASKSHSAALAADLVQSLDSNGFTVGTNAAVNQSGTTVHWAAFSAGAGRLSVGSYTGTGNTGGTRTVTGAGFAPDAVLVLPQSSGEPYYRATGHSRSYRWGVDGGGSDISALAADGFTVSTGGQLNLGGQTYHYVAWNAQAGAVATTTYTGDGVSGRTVSGLGFTPAFVLVRADADPRAFWRSAAMTGATSLPLDDQPAATDAVTALTTDGFRLGTNTGVNASGTTYVALTVRATS